MKVRILHWKRTAFAVLLALLLSVAGVTNALAQEGAINGLFSVSDNLQVRFSQGNLQYIGSATTPYWKFADNQWEYYGTTTGQNSSNQDVDRDLFGWATSGYNHGAVCYQPWSTTFGYSNYYAYGDWWYNLYDQSGQADWGYNAIVNGGNVENNGWRTPTQIEWMYVFDTRNTASGIRWAKGQVNGINGIILVPDNWTTSIYTLNSPNGGNYNSNTITAEDWTNVFEVNGAVFLPAAGRRIYGTTVDNIGSTGGYWSSSSTDIDGNFGYSDAACDISFSSDFINTSIGSRLDTGLSVRLIRNVESTTSYQINATPNPTEGGTIMGAGTYESGVICTLTAIPNEGYTFVNWMEDGNIVSIDTIYSFTVTSDRNLVANFTLPLTITATANPVEGGTVSGMGVYVYGTICTLTATPNEDYVFLSWAENGIVVSADAEYSFTVSSTRTLVANFSIGDSHEYVNLGLPSGTLWATCNVGADSPEDYGDYFAWGETQPKSVYNWDNYTYGFIDPMWYIHLYKYNTISEFGPVDNLTVLQSMDDAASTNWGSDWRMPTKTEFEELRDNTTLTTVTRNGVLGSLFTAQNGNSIFLPSAAFLPGNGVSDGRGFYWSNSLSMDSPYRAFCLMCFTDGYNSVSITDEVDGARAVGLSVRPVRSSPQVLSYIINATPNPTEGGEVSGGGTYQQGQICTLTAVANSSYTFVNWTENGNIVSTDATYSFTITTDRNLLANFTSPFTITAISIPAEGGNIIGAGTYELGVTCTLTATPNDGYTFVNWTENGELVSTEAIYSFTVTGDRSLVANFVISGSNSYEYVDLGLPSGTLWATCNVGADTPEEYGDYFAWGETQTKDIYSWSTYQYCNGSLSTLTKYCNNSNYGYLGFTDSLTTLLPEDDAATANWGTDWRMPTQGEWQELLSNTTNTWTTQNGVYGRLFTATNGNSLFLPAAGYRSGNSLYNGGTYDYYWSSSVSTTSPCYAWIFGYFYSPNPNINVLMYTDTRDYGRSVRAVRSVVIEDECAITFDLYDSCGDGWNGNILMVTDNNGNSYELTLEDGSSSSYPLMLANGSHITLSWIEGNWIDECYFVVSYSNGNVIYEGFYLSGDFSYEFDVNCEGSTDSYNITAEANPATGGTVSGGGEYDYGTECTLTATPNDGYTFVNWTENGDVVSTENPYTFTVTGSRDLVANFATSGGVSYEFVELGLPSGLLWATCNVGADSPEDYGDYFAWGETQPKSVYNWDTYIYGYFYDFETGYLTKYNTNSNYGSVDNLTTLLPEDDAATANWSADWRMPTKEEWEELNNNTVCTWTVRNGVNGWLFSSSNGNSLFLPANGIRWGSELYDVGNMGSYWTSSLYSNQPNHAWYFYSYPSYNITDINQRDRGKAVRAVRFAQELSHINATANPAEGGTVTGSGAYEEGSICTLTATANEGYSFINWTENGNQVSTDPIYSFMVTGNRTLVANFMDENLCVITFDLYDSWGDGWTGNWLVVTDDNGGSYQLTMEDGSSSTQTLMFYNGSHVTLTWINGQYTYECSFTVSYSNGDIIYHSESLSGGFLYEFDVNCGGSTVSYNITAEANPADGGTVSGAGEYDYGNTCTLTATANEGFSFINWTENGTMVSAEATYGFTVTGNRELVANFTMENLPIPVNGLIAYYPFNGNANDESGNGNHGTLCGNQPQPTTDRFGNGNSAYLFGGYFNPGWIHVSNSTSLILDTEMSMSFWINLTDNNGMNGYGNYSTECVMAVVCKAGDGWATNPGFNTLIAPHSGDSLELLSFNSNNGSYDVRTSYHCYVPGQWMHCVVTVENEVAKLYINGVLRQVSTKDPANFYNANNHDLYIGIMDSYWYPFNGKIDDVALYNRALNAQEVGVLYGSEVTTYTIEALPNPVESGIIMGAGTYYTCSKSTLTATANAGYSFINWTENGTVVSTDATYSFIVTNNRNLVANFMEGDVCTITFDLYDSYGDGYTGNYLVVSYGDVIEQLTVESGSSASYTLAIPDGSHVELTWITGSYPEDCSFTVSYSSGEMIYEGSNLSSDFSYEFDVNCNGSSDITQTSSFSQGYNWWSTCIEQEGIDGLEMLQEALGDNGVTIRSQASGYNDYYESYGWFGSLSDINNESSYRVITSAPCSITLTGNAAVPSQHPITLSHGWTWIGYVPSTAMDLNAALANLDAVVGDKVKSQQGYADYYEGYGWFGSLNTIESGMGLMYYSSNSEAVTFTYPDGNRGVELKKNITAENNHWKPNTFAYPDNMTVMAVVELDDAELSSDNYELAAFANGECRGSVKLTYAEPLHRHVAFLTVSGKDAAELSFRLYDTETGVEYYDAEESLDFVTNAIVGDASNLFVIHFKGTTGVDELAKNVQMYPNPVNRGERFSIGLTDTEARLIRVEIMNALGAIVSTQTSTKLPASLVAPETTGVYTVKILVDNKAVYCRKLVVR